jgi:hypothetical protein
LPQQEVREQSHDTIMPSRLRRVFGAADIRARKEGLGNAT